MSSHSEALTKSANGSTVEAKVGAPIHIHLAGNPTTGYTWSGSESTKYTSHIEFKAPNSGLMGAPGEYHITITPKESGSYPVDLKYSRSFEPGKPPAETFSITLNAA